MFITEMGHCSALFSSTQPGACCFLTCPHNPPSPQLLLVISVNVTLVVMALLYVRMLYRGSVTALPYIYTEHTSGE